jgi:acyl-CoA thioesterase-1
VADATAPLVLVAGTSLTAGLGLDPTDAYPAVLQRMADSAGIAARVVNAGLSGETSAGLVRRMDWLLRQHAPAVVVIETGANDGLRGLDADSLGVNLRRIAAAVRERRPEARLLLVQMEAPPNFGPAYTARFRAVYGEVARETGATLVPFLLDGVAGDRRMNQADAIHPNQAGARRVAATVWRALEPALDSLDPVQAAR